MQKFSPKVVFFNLEGGVFTYSDIPEIIKNTILGCRMEYNEDINKEFDEFCKGQISENEFWKNIGVKQKNMPRKLVLEKLEYSFDNDFLPLISGFVRKKIGVYGNIPKEWLEEIFESSGLSAMVQLSILSSDLEEMFPSEKAFNLIKEKIGNALIIDSNMNNIEMAKEKGISAVLLVRNALHNCRCKPDLFVPKLIQLEDLVE